MTIKQTYQDIKASILKGIKDVEEGRVKDLGSFSKYVKEDNMPYIDDEKLFKAVSFASSLRKKGKSIPNAVSIAASYYKVSKEDVASELGKRVNVVKNRMKDR